MCALPNIIRTGSRCQSPSQLAYQLLQRQNNVRRPIFSGTVHKGLGGTPNMSAGGSKPNKRDNDSDEKKKKKKEKKKRDGDSKKDDKNGDDSKDGPQTKA
ncbi:hypothetical protein H0H92_006113 [Tricholoma furcatifolium]|nr:hypothetical protein H0H92_006113 [Tricholoma furcatifolium]